MMTIGSKVRFDKFGNRYAGVVKSVSTNDGRRWYGIKITDRKEIGKSSRSMKLRVGQMEYNYMSNLRHLVVK